jgi:glycosyltransferase involved in cell wall biosynthesis
MKIGMISDTFLPLIGGAEVHVYNLSKKLIESGQDVKIFTNIETGRYKEELIIEGNSQRSFFLINFFWDIIALIKFIKTVDVIHCHYTYYLAAVACPLAKLMGKPSVITLHGLGTLDSSVENSSLMQIYRWVSFKTANSVIGTSEEMVDVAKNFVNEEKIYFIPNAINTEDFKPSNDSSHHKKLIVLSPRRLNPKNGVQYLIEAIPHVIAEFDKIEFWIMGKINLSKNNLGLYLKERVKENNIENFVKFIGEIPNDDMKTYYGLADIIVFPSSAESTSIACLESMAMEKAVVASSLQAYKVLLGNDERGLLVKLFDRESSDYNAPLSLPHDRLMELANAIIKLAENENLRRTLGSNARKFVEEQYDWNIIAVKILQIYAGLL